MGWNSPRKIGLVERIEALCVGLYQKCCLQLDQTPELARRFWHAMVARPGSRLPPKLKTSMLSRTFHILLLFAVAYGQIFGGISCCCLPKIAVAAWSKAFAEPVAAAQHCKTTEGFDATVPRCPRCSHEGSAKRTIAGVHGTAAADGFGMRLACQADDCRCPKLDIGVGLKKDQVTKGTAIDRVERPANDFLLFTPSRSVSADRSDIPIRFGGHSWQSVACLWKN